MEVVLVFKGKSERVAVGPWDLSNVLFDEARRRFALDDDQQLKILASGKQLTHGKLLAETSLKEGAKCMVMATGRRTVDEVVAARADPTVRGFASEDQAAKHHYQQQRVEELSEWGMAQDAKCKFCRFEPCTWQSFGTRPSSKTPHAFEARKLMLKLAHDPAIVRIMAQREWTVGLLAEMDPIDDRLAEKMEGGGSRLLGYNANAGAEIHVRLRSHDLSGFMPYPALVDTLLHELCHNEVGPHNEHFWHLFCQLKADYLRALRDVGARGDVFAGKSALQLAEAADQVADIRSSVLGALQRDRQAPVSPMQAGMLDAYLQSAAIIEARTGAAASGKLGGASSVAAGDSAAAAVPADGAALALERRELLASKALARLGPPTADANAAHADAGVDGEDMVAERVAADTGPSGAEGEAMDVSDVP